MKSTMTSAKPRVCRACCATFFDATKCPSCGSIRTEGAHQQGMREERERQRIKCEERDRQIKRAKEMADLGDDWEDDWEDDWAEPPGLPSQRGWAAVWDELHDMYDDSGNWQDILG